MILVILKCRNLENSNKSFNATQLIFYENSYELIYGRRIKDKNKKIDTVQSRN